jgi:rare lipoprotein A
MRRTLTDILVILVVVTSLEAAQRPSHPEPYGHQKTTQAAAVARPYQVGTASWYGSHFNGKRTASGEVFDMYQLTAAHRRLPMGTRVRVTNLQNGKSVVVRINDRGPLPRSRIIDLSYNAARILGMKAEGLQAVRLDLMAETEAVAAIGSMP